MSKKRGSKESFRPSRPRSPGKYFDVKLRSPDTYAQTSRDSVEEMESLTETRQIETTETLCENCESVLRGFQQERKAFQVECRNVPVLRYTWCVIIPFTTRHDDKLLGTAMRYILRYTTISLNEYCHQ